MKTISKSIERRRGGEEERRRGGEEERRRGGEEERRRGGEEERRRGGEEERRRGGEEGRTGGRRGGRRKKRREHYLTCSWEKRSHGNWEGRHVQTGHVLTGCLGCVNSHSLTRTSLLL